jgi:GTP-binding protein HflX
VLQEIGDADRIPQILVFNKLDLLEPSARPRIEADAVERTPGVPTPRVFVSSKDGVGLEALRRIIAGQVAGTLNAAALPTLAAQPFTEPLLGTA